MALVIEDGSIVANANSYVTDAEYAAYAAQRGRTVGADLATREAELVRAMDYLFALDYKGTRTVSTQAQPWPRYNVFLYGYQTNSDTIPTELKNAQMELAINANSHELSTDGNFSNVAREKLDVMEVAYHNNGKAGKVKIGSAYKYLKPLLNQSNEVQRT